MEKTVISKQEKKFWLYFFLLSILSPVFNQILENFRVSEYITKPLGIVDELFVITFFFISLFVYKSLRFHIFEIVLVLFLSIGFFACIINDVPLHVSILGAFNIVKGMLIYVCFRSIHFSTKEIVWTINKICILLPVLVISDLFDLLWPDFRISIGYGAKQMPEERFGLTSVYGFFAPTTITFLCNTIYVANIVYFKASKKNRYISSIMLLLTLKVKDFFGFMMVVFFSTVKRITKIHIIGAVVTFIILFMLYSIYLPNHYGSYFNYENKETNARVATVFACVEIVKDYFPLGVGFGRFASTTAEQFESPVYAKYKINEIYGLDYNGKKDYINDSFWPMIFGETGILGFAIYIYLLYLCFYPYLKNYFKNTNSHEFAFVSLVFIFELVCSLAKATLNGPPDSHLVWGFAGIYYQIAFVSRNTKRIHL